jgi:arylformamidase
VQRGATIVLVEYDLCPAVTVADIVRQTRAAVVWIYRNIPGYGGDPSKLYMSGHSAGGHLTAMALAHDWRKEGLPPDSIKGALASSGVYDMEMVMHVSANQEIRMTPELARENSPFLHPPLPVCPVIVAVGGAEPEGWKQMSRDYFQLCKENRLECEYLEVPGANHYTMSEHLGDTASPLNRAVMRLMKL